MGREGGASFLDLLAESLSHELTAHKLLVTAILGNELLVSALLNDIALAHANNIVSADDSTESVGNHDNGLLLLLEQLVQGFLHLVLTVGIERACSLI